MPLKAIESQRLYQQVAAQISELIWAGNWAVGQRLPAERELAERLKVSRPTVREAMIALELAGMVEVRTGSGIYVTERRMERAITRPAGEDAGPSPFELIEARRVIEGEVAASAAVRATARDLRGLEEAIARMDTQIAAGTQHVSAEDDGDLLFHRRVAASSHNSTLENIIGELWEGMRQPIFGVLSERSELPENARRAVIEHKQIYDAVRTRDADGARAAMHRHLDHVREILLQEQST